MSAPKAIVQAVTLLATVVTVIALIPIALDALVLGAHTAAHPSEPDANRTAKLAADYAVNEIVDWWVDVFVGLANLSPLLALGFVLLIRWTGHLKD